MLAMALILIIACGDPVTLEGPNGTTTMSPTVVSSSTTTTTAPETTSTRPANTTTSAPATTTTSVPIFEIHCGRYETLDESPPAPLLDLLPPSPSVVPVSDADKYYRWFQAIGTDVYTLAYHGASSGDYPSVTDIEMRLNGSSQHVLVSELGGDLDQIIIIGDQIWVQEGSVEWEEIDELSHMVGMVLAPVSADLWYGVAHAAIDAAEFAGWTEIEGSPVAVYRGGDEAASLGAEELGLTDSSGGTVEFGWDPAGFFRFIAVTFETEFGERSNCWTVTAIDGTTVSPPN